jgi:predicted dehydrogenase
MLLQKRETGGTLVKATPHRAQLRIGLAGCGEVCALKHLPALQRVRGARVVAVAEVDPVRRARVADQFGIEHRFADVSALVASSTVDLVGVLAPPADHAEIAATALAAGAHVLVEKPLTLSLDAADALIAAARAASGRAFMGFHMRWHRLVRRARDVVKAGGLGTLESFHATWNSPRGDEGTPDWKCRRHTGGGALIEIGVHIADLWRFILGTEARQVFAEVRHGRRDDEAASMTARLDGGVLATASISERAGHDMVLDICGDSARVHVAGQRFDGFECYSTAESDGMPGPRIRNIRRTLRELPAGLAGMRTLGDYGDSYRGMWQHVVDAIKSGAPADCTLEDGREALRIVLAATAAAESGRPIRVVDAPGGIAVPQRRAET